MGKPPTFCERRAKREYMRQYRALRRRLNNLQASLELQAFVKTEKRLLSEVERQKVLRAKHERERANWPKGCRSSGSCSPRGVAQVPDDDLESEDLSERLFEREMKRTWRRR